MKPLRILVVEDNALLALVLEELLVGMGHQVCATASTEVTAVNAADQQKPDLMIVDVGLRQGSGISAVDQICRLRPTPYFFLSGDAGRIRATKPDAIVLQKPFRLDDLAKTMDRAWERQLEFVGA